jgi:1,3-beta-glucanosyltransferase GAS3
VLVSDFSNTSVPVFFSEYGCIKPAPRVFTEVPVIYGPLMTPVLSGGMVYEYSEEPDDYGLVQINSNGSAQILPDYDTLQKQFNTLNITYLQDLPAQNLSVTAPKCTSSLITTSGFDSNFTIPDVPPGAQALIDNGISPAPSGKMVTVTATKVTQVVQQSNGDVIQNLAITILADDQSNNPNGGSATTSSSSASATKKKNGGENLKASFSVLLGVASFAAAWTSLL